MYTQEGARAPLALLTGKIMLRLRLPRRWKKPRRRNNKKIKSALKKKRSQIQLNKEIQAIRDEHEKRLVVLCDLADEEISKLKSSVPGEAGPSSAQAGDANFPEDSAEKLTPRPRLFVCLKRRWNKVHRISIIFKK